MRLACWESELLDLITRLTLADRRQLWIDLKVKIEHEKEPFLRRWDKWNIWAQFDFFRVRGPEPWQPPYHDLLGWHGWEEQRQKLRQLDNQLYEQMWAKINKQKEVESWRRKKRRIAAKKQLDNDSRSGAALPIKGQTAGRRQT